MHDGELAKKYQVRQMAKWCQVLP